MAEIEEKCEFETRADQIQLTTKTNGDTIIISGLDFNQGQAASMAWLVNADDEAVLVFKVEVK